MKTFSIMGAPEGISDGLAKLLSNNPEIKVTAMACGQWFTNPTTGLHVAGQQPKPQLAHVLYVTYEGPDAKNENGKVIQ